MMGNQLFQDLLSYSLPLIGCPESSSDEDIHVATGGCRTVIVFGLLPASSVITVWSSVLQRST